MTFAEFVRTKREVGPAEYMRRAKLGDMAQGADLNIAPGTKYLVYLDTLFVQISADGKFPVTTFGEEVFGDTPLELLFLERILYELALYDGHIVNDYSPEEPDQCLIEHIRLEEDITEEEAEYEAQKLLLDVSLLDVRSRGSLEERIEWMLDRFQEALHCECGASKHSQLRSQVLKKVALRDRRCCD